MNFDLGAYGAFIWPAYGVSALALIGDHAVDAWPAWRAAKAQLAALEQEDEALDLSSLPVPAFAVLAFFLFQQPVVAGARILCPRP